MPRKAVSAQERMDREFQAALAAGQTRLGERDLDTMQILNICRAVYYKRKKDPEKFTVEDIRIIANKYRFTDYQLCQIFGVEYTVSGLAVICGAGKDAVRTSLYELENCGYLTRTQRHSETGLFSQNEYIVTDTPSSMLSRLI